MEKKRKEKLRMYLLYVLKNNFFVYENKKKKQQPKNMFDNQKIENNFL